MTRFIVSGYKNRCLSIFSRKLEATVYHWEDSTTRFGFSTESYWFWVVACALLGYPVILNILFSLFLSCLNSLGRPQAVLSKFKLQGSDERRNGEPMIVELRSYLRPDEFVGTNRRPLHLQHRASSIGKKKKSHFSL